jgi:DNA-binding transcriptional MerR regulator
MYGEPDGGSDSEHGGPVDMAIDELARRAGSTTRNVRALQSAGLLLPPRIRGRTAHYDATHLDRLEAVLRLQRVGFSLASIKALFDAASAGRTLAEVLGLRRETARGGALRLLSILPSTVLEGAL